MIKIFFLNHSLVMLPKIITTNAQILKSIKLSHSCYCFCNFYSLILF